MDYKSRHEDFVSGLTGSSLEDVYQVFGLAVASYIAWGLVMNKLPQDHWITVRFVDFFYNWVTPLLVLTIYSSRPLHLVALLAGPPILQRIVFRPKPSLKQKQPRQSAAKQELLKHVDFLTAYRALMLIMTAIAILAVDFRIFPRKYAKVETWGTSVMDLGVGSFVFSNGIVSARPILQRGLYGKKMAGWNQVTHLSGEIFALGILRLVLVKMANYQEHVTEYGVHWNFFITMGVLPLALPLFQWLANYVPMYALGLFLAVAYEVVLKNTGLMEWVLTAERTTLLSQNKEGICSVVGFIAIFLIGQATGYYLLPNVRLLNSQWAPKSPSDVGRADKLTQYKIKNLVLYWFAFELLFRIFRSETQISRRLANLPYILWVVSFNLLLVACFAGAGHFLKFGASESMLSVNKRGQAMFLLANVATGLINMSVDTIDASTPKSMIVLLGYLVGLYAASLLLTRSKGG